MGIGSSISGNLNLLFPSSVTIVDITAVTSSTACRRSALRFLPFVPGPELFPNACLTSPLTPLNETDGCAPGVGDPECDGLLLDFMLEFCNISRTVILGETRMPVRGDVWLFCKMKIRVLHKE